MKTKLESKSNCDNSPTELKHKWKSAQRRKHCARAGCSKVQTPPARPLSQTERTDYNTLRRS